MCRVCLPKSLWCPYQPSKSRDPGTRSDSAGRSSQYRHPCTFTSCLSWCFKKLILEFGKGMGHHKWTDSSVQIAKQLVPIYDNSHPSCSALSQIEAYSKQIAGYKSKLETLIFLELFKINYYLLFVYLVPVLSSFIRQRLSIKSASQLVSMWQNQAFDITNKECIYGNVFFQNIMPALLSTRKDWLFCDNWNRNMTFRLKHPKEIHKNGARSRLMGGYLYF